MLLFLLLPALYYTAANHTKVRVTTIAILLFRLLLSPFFHLLPLAAFPSPFPLFSSLFPSPIPLLYHCQPQESQSDDREARFSLQAFTVVFFAMPLPASVERLRASAAGAAPRDPRGGMGLANATRYVTHVHTE